MLLSRLAETVFWFGRYMERAEDMARAISAHGQLCLDMPGERSPGWTPLLSLCDDAPASWSRSGRSEQEAVLRFLITEPGNPSSVLSTVTRAREDLRMSRPIVPKNTWHTLNGAYLSLLEVARAPSLITLNDVLSRVLAACQQVNAEVTATMTHDDAYAFLRMGRYVERATMLLRITTSANVFDRGETTRPFDDVRWMGLLNALGAYQMYRRNHHGHVHPDRAFAFLLGDERFPRSLNHCVAQVQRELRRLPHSAALQVMSERSRALCSYDPAYPTAAAYARERLAEISALAAAIESTYFGRAAPASSLDHHAPEPGERSSALAVTLA